MTTLSFTIEKAPDGGYALRRVEFRDGAPVVLPAIKFANDQQEIWRKLHQMGEEVFKETAWKDTIIERQVIREFMGRPQQPPPMPTQQPQIQPQHEDPLPHVVQAMQADPPRAPQHSLVEKTRVAMNGGRASAFAWFAILVLGMSQVGMRLA